MEETPMIPAADMLTAAINADPRELRVRGWSDESLPARQRALETLRGWLTGVQIEPPTPAELTPLVAVWQSGTPAATEAERLLMLLELGRALTDT
ncbi:MAG: hypothetical protein Kow0031_40190 [Anaerolineae bacterium]